MLGRAAPFPLRFKSFLLHSSVTQDSFAGHALVRIYVVLVKALERSCGAVSTSSSPEAGTRLLKGLELVEMALPLSVMGNKEI
jgi:hypothetical protein